MHSTSNATCVRRPDRPSLHATCVYHCCALAERQALQVVHPVCTEGSSSCACRARMAPLARPHRRYPTCICRGPVHGCCLRAKAKGRATTSANTAKKSSCLACNGCACRIPVTGIPGHRDKALRTVGEVRYRAIARMLIHNSTQTMLDVDLRQPLSCAASRTWGHSSAGRAPAWHAGGRRFDPVWLHQPLESFNDFAPRPHRLEA